MHWQQVRAACLFALFTGAVSAQQPAAPETANATCTFEDGRQARVSYSAVTDVEKRDLPKDKLWTPGNLPMNLFLDTAVSMGGAQIPAGAYSMYIVPGKGSWTLVVNKDVTPGHSYDISQDLMRASMETGQLTDMQKLQVAFARSGPKQCSLRIYYGKIGTWAVFDEK
jgi:hypothetical protein